MEGEEGEEDEPAFSDDESEKDAQEVRELAQWYPCSVHYRRSTYFLTDVIFRIVHGAFFYSFVLDSRSNQ